MITAEEKVNSGACKVPLYRCKSCGGKAIVANTPERSFAWSVRCENAGKLSHRGGSRVAFGKTEGGAIAVWNRQQGDAATASAAIVAPQREVLVFPPMDEAAYAEKFARWQRRVPRTLASVTP